MDRRAAVERMLQNLLRTKQEHRLPLRMMQGVA
jgi:hypothetical protein